MLFFRYFNMQKIDRKYMILKYPEFNIFFRYKNANIKI